jgi:putative hydrolase of the HAD superfamily
MRSSSRSAGLDAVTVDAFGTLVALEDPSERLQLALAAHGIDRPRETVRAAFRAEAAHYRPRSIRGRDARSLHELRVECVGVFLEEADANLEPTAFVDAFMGALVFRLADGALPALNRLAAVGLELACVANWDVGLRRLLTQLGVADRFRVVLSSAEAGSEKPDPAIFRLALERLDVTPERALHVGDERADRDGAAAAELAFEPAPLATLPERLGIT